MDCAVTVARQGVLLDDIDADEVIELLEHAAVIIGYLADDPHAEQVNIELTTGERTLRVLAIDLALAAAELTDATHPGQGC